MAKIDPKDLEALSTSGIEVKTDANGYAIGFKGPWLPDWYDDRMEMMRENQAQHEKDVLAKQGLNAQAQTPEQAKNLQRGINLAKQRKEKALDAAEVVKVNQ